MRKLIYISLIALAGCETPLSVQPPPSVTNSDLSGFFWPDSTAAYLYQSSQGSHKIQVVAGGTIFDVNQSNFVTTNFTVTKSNASYAISGFTSSDVFGLDPWLEIVSDTLAPPPQFVPIRSIATATPGGFGQPTTLYALSDSVLYALDSKFSLDPLVNFPPHFVLAEDAQNEKLFAYQPNGNIIAWTSDKDCSVWFADTAAGSITAFASSDFYDLCWFACGNDLYRISVGYAPQKVASLSSTIIGIVGESNGEVVVALNDGSFYEVSRTGQLQKRQGSVPSVQGIAYVPGPYNYPVLAATPNGVFAVTSSGPSTQISPGSASLIYSTGYSIFANMSSDSVFHSNANGTPYSTFANPEMGTAITQFAKPTTVTSPSNGFYALAGTNIYRRDSTTTGFWTQANQVVAPPWHPNPGTLVLLKDTTNWLAGYVVNNEGGHQQSYAYQATNRGSYAQISLDSVTYNNVLIVQYTAYSNGIANNTDVPEYVIYYEQGKGPIRIDRTEKGNSVIIRRLQ